MKQIIIQFLTGQDDRPITEGSNALQHRFNHDAKYAHRQNRSPIYTITGSPGQPIVTDEQSSKVGRDALRSAISACDGEVNRLYLRGHGEWQSRKLGDWSAKEIDTLIDRDFCIGTISVTGCKLGRAPKTTNYDANDVRLRESAASFAGELAALWKGCFGKLNAWIVDVTIKTDDTLLGGIERQHQNIANGRKIFESANGLSPQVKHTKITFDDMATPAWKYK